MTEGAPRILGGPRPRAHACWIVRVYMKDARGAAQFVGKAA